MIFGQLSLIGGLAADGLFTPAIITRGAARAQSIFARRRYNSRIDPLRRSLCMEPYIYGALIGLAGAAALTLLYVLAVGGGSLARLGLACQAFNKVMGSPEIAAKVDPILNPPPPPPPVPPKLSGEPLRLLALLQREGRLLDFLLEDVAGATDEQLGAGVREVHKKSRAVVKEHLTLEPVLPGEEEAGVTVPAGFDPSAVRLTGNVTGQPPFQGVLKHHGWRVTAYRLPAPPAGSDDLVVAPAEVELP
jgi:Domain of unknown function (DUF2760)